LHRITVSIKADLPDPRGVALQRDIKDLGISASIQARVSDIYLLEGSLAEAEVQRICQELLCDPVVQEYSLDDRPAATEEGVRIIEVAHNPGVMDPVEESVRKGIRDLGIRTAESVKTAKRYLLQGDLSSEAVSTICDKLLVNPVIQHVVREREVVTLPSAIYHLSIETIPLSQMNDDELLELSKHRLWLNLEEMKRVQDHFSKLGRDPTDAELETIAQTWSEHCVHKTFRAKIKLGDTVIDSLIKSTLMQVTTELDKPWCLSVFRDNAGVIDFDGEWAVCFKVETHNHPSAVEPYGGAATGIGGVEPNLSPILMCSASALRITHMKCYRWECSTPAAYSRAFAPVSLTTATASAYQHSTARYSSTSGMSAIPWSTAAQWGFYPRA